MTNRDVDLFTGGVGHPANPQAPGTLPGGTPSPTDPNAPAGGPGARPTDPVAVSGNTPLKTDPGTSGILRDYQKGMPSALRSGPLDFGSSAVTPDRINALVTEEGGDPAKVNDAIQDVGGPGAQVTQSPILLRNDKGSFGTATLFDVKGADGQTHLVDSDGAHYSDINDYMESNRFDDSWTMVRAARPGEQSAGTGQLVSGPAHATTAWQKVGKVGDKIAQPMAAVGGGMVLGAGAATLVSGGTAAPAAAPVAAVGGAMAAIGGGWMALRGGSDLFDRYRHGRSVELSDPEARADYENAAIGLSSVAGAGGIFARGVGAVGRATLADRTAIGLAGASVAGQTYDLHNDWSRLSPSQRAGRAAELGASVGMLGFPAAGRSAVKGGADRPVEPEAPSSPLVPGGGLQAHENIGGHTLDPLKAHVGASDADMMHRFATDPTVRRNGVSSFYDRATAERAIRDTIDSNQSEIDNWLQGASRPPQPFMGNMNYNVGRRLDPASGKISDVRNLRVVLKRDPSDSRKYFILSAFPRP